MEHLIRTHIPGDTIVTDILSTEKLPFLWDIVETKLQQVWDKGITGEGVNLCVMDTGYTPHPNLPAPIAFRNFTSNGTQNDVTDRHGHGNWCNGRTIGRGGVGVAPGAKLIIAKVLGDRGSGNTGWTDAGRIWAAEQGAHITSVSIGGGCSSSRATPNSMLKANELGTLLECDAAGNAGYNGKNSIDCPGKYLEGYCVGAYRKDGRIANFSSGGREIDVACPGQDCISTSHRGSGWTTMSGTSMSTPFFAGLMCLIVQKRRHLGYPDKEMTGAEAWRKFFVSEMFEDAGEPGKDVRFGLGKPLILKIIDWLGDYTNI